MVAEPFGEFAAPNVSRCELEHDFHLVIHRRVNLMAVQDEESFHGGVASPLVASDKWMVLDE
jgi:hypothetical protein